MRRISQSFSSFNSSSFSVIIAGFAALETRDAARLFSTPTKAAKLSCSKSKPRLTAPIPLSSEKVMTCSVEASSFRALTSDSALKPLCVTESPM